jgi:putative endonuclease
MLRASCFIRMSNQSFGRIGQNFAEKYLRGLGYKIIAKNFNTRWGEIDIIAKDGDCFVFVEVKTRRDDSFGAPEEAVTKTKQRHLLAAAQIYLAKIFRKDDPWRVDVIALTGDGVNFAVNHIKNAVCA